MLLLFLGGEEMPGAGDGWRLLKSEQCEDKLESLAQ